MSIRNLGDWSPLDRGSDPIHADPDQIHVSQGRYKNIATTIEDSVATLTKIVETNSESLAGQYVDALREDAQSLRDRLTKAGVRYSDVAREIAIYEPELDRALHESAGALEDARAAEAAQTKADAMPDPQEDEDGSVSAEERQKGRDKTAAQDRADGSLSAARSRLDSALAALDVAGKRLGDNVNEKRYEDGLTDSFKDKLDAVMAQISRIFAIIGMVFAVLAILIPGVNVLVLGSVVAGAVALVANTVLYAHGKGSVLDVVLGAVGLGLAGVGAGLSLVAKGMSQSAQSLARITRGFRTVNTRPPQLNFTPGGMGQNINLGRMTPGAPGVPAGGPSVVQGLGPARNISVFPPVNNSATQWRNLSDWFNNPATNWLLGKGGQITPDVGFWRSTVEQLKGARDMWKGLFSNPGTFAKDWAGVIGGWSGYRDLSAVMSAVGGKASPLWMVWGGFNGTFELGGNLVYNGGRLEEWMPSVNPPGVAEQG
ncbi:hypothetical protein JQN72_17640 [Phycicoccus sp. CSK15P-2]|uniref:hypothetical protein n=1 Tax=Phycicoccus sp. CSK15P-2 TaxID=2807627 RepID=UPI00195222AD|nr:hypothetical protein [Phycicoccus sp. CSK15P-2]MBM6406063.1 hypothetical protein [Phycicoccus sp. CSK15P-2]